MRLTRCSRTMLHAGANPDELRLRQARVEAARRVPGWNEIAAVDLVKRGRVFVSAESDRVFAPYRGALWMTGTISPISDRSPLLFTVDGDKLEFYEQLPGSWSERVKRQAERDARRGRAA